MAEDREIVRRLRGGTEDETEERDSGLGRRDETGTIKVVTNGTRA